MHRRDWMLKVLALSALPSLSQADVWSPHFLNSDQNQTLVALGEAIVPGSAAAQCNRLIDLVLPIESEKNKQDLLAALAAFDRAARTRQNQAFAQLAPAEQTHLLTAAAAPDAPLHHDFQLVKEWIADAYWSSQQGLADLGSTGRMAWSEFPNCPSAQAHN